MYGSLFTASLLFFTIFCWIISKDRKTIRDRDLWKEHSVGLKRVSFLFGSFAAGLFCYALLIAPLSNWEFFTLFGTIMIHGLIAMISYVISFSSKETKASN